MANLPESATYDAGVYQLELTDPVQGGPTGVSNAPLKNLANRTAWLKSQIDGIKDGAVGLALYARLASPTFTGSPTAPTAALGDNTTKLATTAFVQETLGGFLSKSIAGTGSVTLTAVEAGNGIIELTGALTGNRDVIVPSSPTRPWIIRNATTGAFSVTVKTAAGTGVSIPQGKSLDVYCDGTNVVALLAPQLATARTIALSGDASGSASFDGSANTTIPVTVADDSHNHSISTVSGLQSALDSKQAVLGYTPLNKGGDVLAGPLAGRVGALVAGNANNAGFVFDYDTGLFSPSDGILQLGTNALVRIQISDFIRHLYQVRAPKGAPSGGNTSANAGYAFAEDGDTGMFAEGGDQTSGSVISIRIDGGLSAVFRQAMSWDGGNVGWALMSNGIMVQWGEFTQNDNGGAVGFNITLPTAFPKNGRQGFLTVGSAIGGGGIVASIEGFGTTTISGFTQGPASPRKYRYFVIGS